MDLGLTGGNSTKQQTDLAGVIEEVLPNALFRVRLDGGAKITANISTSLRHQVVRLISGNRVNVQLSRHDPTRGRITEKL